LTILRQIRLADRTSGELYDDWSNLQAAECETIEVKFTRELRVEEIA
jgi:hypothetical protein